MYCIAAFCSSATHFFLGSFLALIPYLGVNLFSFFWAVDIVGFAEGDVWDEVAPFPIHLSQQIVDTFYKVNEANVFVVKRRKLMDPMKDGIHKGEGANDSSFVESEGEQEGSHKSDEGPQDSEKGRYSSDREQGLDEESKTSSDEEESLEHVEHTSMANSDDDTFNGDG